jgi:hypothetical protein
MLNMGTSFTIQKSHGWVLGTVLKLLLDLRVEIEIFMNEKGKVVVEPSDEKVDLGFGITMRYQPSSDFNSKLQRQEKLISDMFGAARPFEMDLTFFWKELKNVNLCNFSSCDVFARMDQ